MKIYDTSIFCPLHCKKSRGHSTDRLRCYRKLYESQICEVAATPYQADERAKKAIERRWYRKQKWRTTPLYRSTSSDGKQLYQPSILPHRTRGAESDPWVPMVCCHPTKDRLEMRMDQSYAAPSNPTC